MLNCSIIKVSTLVFKRRCTIFEIANIFQILLLPSVDKSLISHDVKTFSILTNITFNFFSCSNFLSFEKWVPKLFKLSFVGLTLFKRIPHFYTPLKRQKIKGFLTFSGGIEIDHWCEKGQYITCHRLPR